MWHSKDIVLKTKDSRELKNAIRALETKFLNILNKICDYRLNFQVHKCLTLFRRFEESNLNPTVSSLDQTELQMSFQELFSYH